MTVSVLVPISIVPVRLDDDLFGATV
jgi:hypothetical protein